MKTLNEVIKALESARVQVETGNGLWVDYRDNDDLKADALCYLKEYKNKQNVGTMMLALHNTNKTVCDDCWLSREMVGEGFKQIHKKYIKEENPPLTWNELKTMEGKPVWIEWTKTEESYWCFVGEWFDDDEMRIYHIGRDYADYIHKTIYTPDIVQAYRKERE